MDSFGVFWQVRYIMAKAFTVDINQLTQLQKRVQDMEKGLQQRVRNVVIAEMQEAANDAKKAAPVYGGDRYRGGTLRGSIGPLPPGDVIGIIAQVKYGAFVEFGTGSGVQVPTILNETAAQFKGRGLRNNNMRARPYLYPAFFAAVDRIKKMLPKIILNR